MFLNRHHKYGSFENINITTCIQSLHYYDPIKVTCNVNNMDLLLAVFPSLMTKFAVTERHGVNCSWLIEEKKRRIVHFEQLHSIKSVHSFLCWLAFNKTHCTTYTHNTIKWSWQLSSDRRLFKVTLHHNTSILLVVWLSVVNQETNCILQSERRFA